MKLLVGLGNPGAKYEKNRHNVGFLAVDRIAEEHGFSAWRRRFQGHTADGNIGGERVILLKPATYMNDSGRSVGEAARFLKIPEEDIVVLYDEIDLAPGKLKVKTGGGNAGHNGLRSISAHLGNDYVRIRIGVGHPGRKDLVANYVLHDFAKSDYDWLDPLLDAIAGEAAHLAKGDAARFLSVVTQKLAPEKPKEKPAAKTSQATGTDHAAAKKPTSARHPSGDREAKRQSALAENLKKWMARRPADKD